MKKLFFGCLSAALVLTMISCASLSHAPELNASTMNMASPGIDFAPLSSEDYTVLGAVSGTGSVSYNSNTREYTGDTLKYGSFGSLSSIGSIRTENVYGGLWGNKIVGTRSVVITPANAREMAIGNATYALIERAKALNADAVIFVTTSIETSGDSANYTTSTKATVSGIAIKLK